MLLLVKKHTDTLIEQRKTRPQETLESVVSGQTKTFSFDPPINLAEKEKWSLVVTSFEANYYVFNITDKNISFSLDILGHWDSESAEETINEVNILF